MTATGNLRGLIRSPRQKPLVERFHQGVEFGAQAARQLRHMGGECGATKSAPSSASRRSVLRVVPICARMVSRRERSMNWLARGGFACGSGRQPDDYLDLQLQVGRSQGCDPDALRAIAKRMQMG